MKKRILCSVVALSLSATVVHATTPDRASIKTYNAQGLVASVDGPRTDVSDVTQYTYDTSGRLSTVTDALGHVTSFDTYDMYGNPGRSMDANGVVTTMAYTPEGWLQSTTRDSAGTPATTTVTYNAIGDVVQTKDADGVVVGYTYDDARRLTDIADAFGNHIHYTLDTEGNRLKEEIFDASGALKRSVARTFNSLSQLLTVTDALQHTVLTYAATDGYDAAGHPQHSSDAAGIQRKLGYDALGRLVSTIENYNGTDTASQNSQRVVSYDSSDQVEGIGDPDAIATVYDRNGLGDLKSFQSADTGTTAYTYDAAGNVLTRLDANGNTRTFAYDALNRVTGVSFVDTTLNISYSYDEPNSVTGCASSVPIGRLTRILEGAVSTTYCYDARGNVVEKRQAQGRATDTTRYTYTLAGRLSSMTTPGQTLVQYSRDLAGRITSVSTTPIHGAGSTVASNIVYLPFGPITSYTLGNGQVVTRTYDANYQLADIASPIFNWHVSRDAMGNIIALGDAAGANPATETYQYDPLYRLAQVNDANGQAIEAYTYNKTGDRLTKTASGTGSGLYTYDADTHHLTSIGNQARLYDANGNTTGSAVGGDAFGFTYNGRNRLVSVLRNGRVVGTYVYNALNERVAKSATFPQVVNQRFVYDEGHQILGEYGDASRDYVWVDDLPVAVIDSTATSSATSYVVSDGLNTPRAVSDGAGATVWQWSYKGNPFGEQQPTSTSGFVYNLRFPGQYYDSESGLGQNVNRDYEATTGRYIESDPSGLMGGMATYAYVGNQPLTYEDLLGLAPGHHEFPQSIWRGLQNLSRDASRLFDDAVINPATRHGWSRQHAAYNRIARQAWDRFCQSTRANADDISEEVAQDFLDYLRQHPEIARFNSQVRTGEPLSMPDEAAPYPELPAPPPVAEPPVVEPPIIEPPIVEPIFIP
ncbi:RHS repeat protein [Dyella sp. LX-66]|uniref:RHS repeat-associated core domain-containing protein n=1 Tax=unclassified Dyella TaxID=2634549 RepID=UPI001BE0C66E|nr:MULTISPECIES: RHS repeat-associated core domain-containing protein [unclassified Dyella]MBT2117802.1 RHS repeat protein [Dyella sp. LX-1]MBT2141317.1 RHS repeat protein [Dyella sp. LX-66]